MNISLGKLFATAFMAAMLVGSGVAWALQNCTFAGEAPDHAHVLHDQSADRLTPVEHPQHPLARIHCPENHALNVSLGVTSSAFRLQLPDHDLPGEGLPATERSSNEPLVARAIRSASGPPLSVYLSLLRLRI